MEKELSQLLGVDEKEVMTEVAKVVRVVNSLQEIFKVRSAEAVLDAVVDYRRHVLWTGALLGQTSMYVRTDEVEDANALLGKIEESHDKRLPILFLAAGPSLNADLCFNFLPASQFDLRRKDPSFKSTLITVQKKSEFLYAFFKVLRHYVTDKLGGKVGNYEQLDDVIRKVWDACSNMAHPVLEYNVDKYSKLKFYSSSQELIDLIKEYMAKRKKRVYAGDIKIEQ